MANQDRTRALLDLLYHVSREVATALDLRTVLQRVLYEAIQNVGGERGSIVVLDDTGKPVDATIVYGKRFHEHTTQQLRDTVERGLAGWVVRHRKSALVPDTSQDERWLRRPDDSIQKTGAKSAVCVPLLARERLIGVLTLVHSLPNAFGPEHLEIMQAIADQAGVAVLNARLYTESQRQARVMTALAEGAAAINASLETGEVLQRILNQTMQALQVETVALALIDGATGDLAFRAAGGQNAGNIIGRRVPAGKGIAGAVVRDGRGVVLPDVSQEKRFGEVDRFGGIEARAVAIAPILAQGRVIGVLEAINPVSGAFDPDALLAMTGIGSLAGTTIQNAQLFERLQAAHQRYLELFEENINPILITDWEGRVLEANRRAVELSGYGEEQIHNQNVAQLFEIDRNKTGAEFERLRNDLTCCFESSLRHQEGRAVPVEVYVRRVEFEESDALQWMLNDISARKDLDSLREDLTAMIYHDLRSPLANMVSSLEMLSAMLSSHEDEAARSVLNIALHSTARLQRLISSLLDINRLESGQPIVNQKAIAPLELIREAIKDVEPLSSGRRQTVEAHLPQELPLIWVDADMIRRVLINLLENSIKFTPAGGQVEIGAQNRDGWLQVWVRDNGPGIAEADQERIFDKFTRLRSSQVSGGLGVGLAFCRLAVQGHGGRIWVESRPGKGATFSFTLPVARPEQATASVAKRP